MEQKIDFLEELGNFNFISKYARYNELMSRRETWSECVRRVEKMHLDKFKHLPKEDIDEIKWAFSLVDEKQLVPSMRSMQFGGKAILAHNARIYNCATRHVDCIRAFSELFYLLLAGCGIGIGLTKKYLNRLPDLVGPKDKTGTVITYTIQDSIEGWSDTIEALLSCYFKNTAYSGRKIVFDYSRIRPEGSPVKTGGGKAPGYKGLKRSLIKIKELLDHIIEDLHLTRIRSIDAYDILMHCADAVLSGGIRRSASTVIFSKDDTDMMNAKTHFKVDKHTKFSYDSDTLLHYGKVTVRGKKYDVELTDYDFEELKKGKISWFHIEPQRARSNNSVLLLRNNTTQREFLDINELTKQFGEPGFVWANSEDQLFNPCFDRNTRIATSGGLIKIGDLYDTYKSFDAVADLRIGKGNDYYPSDYNVAVKKATAVALTQKNADIYELITEHGNKLLVTDNHTFIVPNKGRVLLKDLQIGDDLLIQPAKGAFGTVGSYNDGLLLGSVTGDGTFSPNTLNATATVMTIWDEDFDVLDDFKSRLNETIKDIPNYNQSTQKEWTVLTKGFNSGEGKSIYSTQLFNYFRDKLSITSPVSIKDRVPECVWRGTEEMVRGYLHGIIFTDGSVNLKCASKGTISTLNIEICQSNEKLLQDIQILLNNFGIVSRLYKLHGDQEYMLPDGKGGSKLYPCKASYRLSINRPNSIKLFNTIGLYGRKHELLKNLLEIRGTDCRKPEKYITSVKSIKFSHKDDVFCFTQPETNSTIANGLSVGQCFEIGMIPISDDGVCGVQFCNLTTINGLKINTREEFMNAIKAVTIIGTLQASYTHFPYLGNASKQITEKEALLGVSVGGFMNNPEVLLKPQNQQDGALLANLVNEEWAKKIGINPAARITCVKPDGNTGATLGCASGIHGYHSRRFFRRVQCNKQDNIYKFFKKQNPHMCELSVWSSNKTDDVITFPITVPDKAMVKSDLTAIQHLEIIKSTQQNWVIPGTSKYNTKPVTHNVSCTVIVEDNEWDNVFNYVYENKQFFAAVSFIPKKGDKIYKQAPMESVVTVEDKQKWDEIVSKYKPVNYKLLTEDNDNTKAIEAAACVGNNCELP